MIAQYALLTANPATTAHLVVITDANPSTAALSFAGGTVTKTSVQLPSVPQWITHYRISGLSPNTLYPWTLSGVAGKPIKTLPATLPSNLRFAVISDTHAELAPGQTGGAMTLPTQMDPIAQRNPDVILMVGDMVSAGKVTTGSDFWVTWAELFLSRLSGPHLVPCYYAPGNHDVGNHNWDGTLASGTPDPLNNRFRFFFPNASDINPGKNYASIKIANHVQIIGMDFHSAVASEMGTWVPSVIDPTMPVCIPLHHPPMLMAGTRNALDPDLSANVRNNTFRVLRQAGNVKVRFCGHIHIYGRSVPLGIAESNPSQTDLPLAGGGWMVPDPDGIIEIGQGYRGGRNGITAWYLDQRTRDLHTFNIVDVGPTTFQVTTINAITGATVWERNWGTTPPVIAPPPLPPAGFELPRAFRLPNSDVVMAQEELLRVIGTNTDPAPGIPETPPPPPPPAPPTFIQQPASLGDMGNGNLGLFVGTSNSGLMHRVFVFHVPATGPWSSLMHQVDVVSGSQIVYPSPPQGWTASVYVRLGDTTTEVAIHNIPAAAAPAPTPPPPVTPPPNSPTPGSFYMASSVTLAEKSTWTFDKNYEIYHFAPEAGPRFIYVRCPNGITINNATPASVNVATIGVPSGFRAYGVMKNPWIGAGTQGFDEILAQFNGTETARRTLYDEHELNVCPSLKGPLHLSAAEVADGVTLVKSFRRSGAVDKGEYWVLEDYVFLYFGRDPLPANAIPAASGALTKQYPTMDQINWSAVRSLPISSLNTFTAPEIYARTRHTIGTWGATMGEGLGEKIRRFRIEGPDAGGAGYGSDMAMNYSRLIFALHTDTTTTAMKRQIAQRLITAGLEIKAIVARGGDVRFGAGQGALYGLLLFAAGALLNRADIWHVAKNINTQTWDTTNWINAAKLSWPPGTGSDRNEQPGLPGMVGLPYLDNLRGGSGTHVGDPYKGEGGSVASWEILATGLWANAPGGETGVQGLLNGAVHGDVNSRRGSLIAWMDLYRRQTPYQGNRSAFWTPWFPLYDAVRHLFNLPIWTGRPDQVSRELPNFAGITGGIQWALPSGINHSGPARTSQDVRISIDGRQWIEHTGVANPGSITGLLRGWPHYCGMRFGNSVGKGEWSPNYSQNGNRSYTYAERNIATPTGTVSNTPIAYGAGSVPPRLQYVYNPNWAINHHPSADVKPFFPDANSYRFLATYALPVAGAVNPSTLFTVGHGYPSAGHPAPDLINNNSNVSYQWRLDGAAIPGATGRTFDISPISTPANVGKNISFSLTIGNGQGSPVTVQSDNYAIPAPPPLPSGFIMLCHFQHQTRQIDHSFIQYGLDNPHNKGQLPLFLPNISGVTGARGALLGRKQNARPYLVSRVDLINYVGKNLRALVAQNAEKVSDDLQWRRLNPAVAQLAIARGRADISFTSQNGWVNATVISQPAYWSRGADSTGKIITSAVQIAETNVFQVDSDNRYLYVRSFVNNGSNGMSDGHGNFCEMWIWEDGTNTRPYRFWLDIDPDD